MKVESYSWSRYNRFETCGTQFQYIYCEKLKRPPGIALFRGRGVHAGAEVGLKTKMAGQAPSLEAVKQAASDHLDAAFKGEFLVDGDYLGMSVADAKADVRNEVLATTEEHFRGLLPLIEPTAVEVKVTLPPSDTLPAPFIGVLDTVDREVVVRDLKTKRKAPDGDFAETSGQLTTYALLFAALNGRYPEKVIGDFVWRTPGKGIVKSRSLESTRNRDDVAILVRRMQAQTIAIEKEIFLPAAVDSPLCAPKYCGYTDICPYFAGRPRPTT